MFTLQQDRHVFFGLEENRLEQWACGGNIAVVFGEKRREPPV
jgi:hypothetical protein